MKGGTTFHFVTTGIHSALERAREAAAEKDVRIGGGPSTIRQYLAAGLIDEMHVAVGPVILGKGEPLFQGLDLRQLGYSVTKMIPGERAVHMTIGRTA
jgi:dihydrofolate reductase